MTATWQKGIILNLINNARMCFGSILYIADWSKKQIYSRSPL